MPEAILWRPPDAVVTPPPAVGNVWLRRALEALLSFVGVLALWGGAALALGPDGRFLQMPLSWLDRTPFADYTIPGYLLFGLGVLHAAALFALWRRTRGDWLVAGVAGGGIVVWIVAQLALTRMYFWLQPVMVLFGLATWVLAVWLGWQEVVAPRRVRFA